MLRPQSGTHLVGHISVSSLAGSPSDALSSLSAESPRDWQTLINLTELFLHVTQSVPDAAVAPAFPFLASRLIR